MTHMAAVVRLPRLALTIRQCLRAGAYASFGRTLIVRDHDTSIPWWSV